MKTAEYWEISERNMNPTPREREVCDIAIRAVCEAYGLTEEALFAPTRKVEVSVPRNVAMGIASRMKARQVIIGKRFGKCRTAAAYAKKLLDAELFMRNGKAEEAIRIAERLNNERIAR